MNNLKKWNEFLNESNRLDQILDKISDTGMESLTRDELNYLNSVSNDTKYVPEEDQVEIDTTDVDTEIKTISDENEDDIFDDSEYEEDEDLEFEDEVEFEKAQNMILLVVDLTTLDQLWYSQFMEDSGGASIAVVAFTPGGEIINKNITDVCPILKDLDLWDEIEGYMCYDPSGEWSVDELIDELNKIGFKAYPSDDPKWGKFLK